MTRERMLTGTMVRPPGFEVPSRCLDGFPGRWVGSPLDATRGYVLDQARLRPLTMRQSRCLFCLTIGREYSTNAVASYENPIKRSSSGQVSTSLKNLTMPAATF